ncbi:hypothetical protein L2D14_00615 [Thalassospiraceae bacterium LMO-JJ14]|nr:hypothetical protein L2D14_00615 [Thalassospiraceae bacterium LMO-JJ14]
MVKTPKSSEVLMYGEKAPPSAQHAEIISVGKDGKPIVEKGGIVSTPQQQQKPKPSPKSAQQPAPQQAQPKPAPAPAAQKPQVAAKAPAPAAAPAKKPASKIKNPASAKEQSKALASSAVGSFVDQMKQAAQANGGVLSLHDIDAMQSSFEQKAREMQAQIEATLDNYAEARDQQKWSKERVDPFFRLMVKPFAHMFAEKPSRKGVTRRILPGYFMAIGMLLGPDIVSNYHERCRGIVARLKSEAGEEHFDWESFYGERDALTVRLDAQVIVAAQFSDYDKRSGWFINLVNSHLGALPDSAGEAEQRWSLDEPGFRRMMDAMLSDLRKVLSSEKGRERLVKRHGAEIVDNANTALKRLLMG